MGAAMSSAILVLLLFLLIAAPALFAFLRQDLGWKTGGFYALVASALLAWHVGFSVGNVPDVRAIARPPAAALEGTRCEQALTAAERGRIVLDRSNPDRLVVSGEVWQQLPDEVRTALTECAGAVRPADKRDAPVEIVTR
jgi:hypothetical protein